jgi:translation elongation factor EF-1beta
MTLSLFSCDPLLLSPHSLQAAWLQGLSLPQSSKIFRSQQQPVSKEGSKATSTIIFKMAQEHERDPNYAGGGRATSTNASADIMDTSITNQLQRLGDPSGRQDATYWDDWFQIVCRDNDHKPFEWYCDCEQVARVLKFHLLGASEGQGQGTAGIKQDDSKSTVQTRKSKKRMIHPGSGTSLLPLALQADFPDYEHVVVDVSEIAIQEMKEIHSKQASNTAVLSHVEYRITNLLVEDDNDSHVGFEENSFQCWIDKGFVDAVFSKTSTKKDNDNGSDRQQASRLFQNACRILQSASGSSIDDNDKGSDWDESVAGFALIISLAEDHSFHLVLDNWLQKIKRSTRHDDGDQDVSVNRYWTPCLDIWELVPVSGNMRPFGFVLTKANTNHQRATIAHSLEKEEDEDENVTVIVRWHGLDDVVQEIYNNVASNDKHDDKLRTVILEHLSQSRKFLMDNVCAKKDEVDERLVMVTLEVKPLDADVDLVALAQLIQTCQFQVQTSSSSPSSSHRYLQPQWRPVSLHQESSSSNNDNCGGNDLLLYEIVPIGFGLSKLVVTCVLPSDDVDELVTLIEETFGNDHVQSVDVDWSRTIPVMSNAVCISKLQSPSISQGKCL